MSSNVAALPAGDAVRGERAFGRADLFFWLFLIAVANRLVGMMLVSVDKLGWTSSLFNLFEISAILWVALAAGLLLMRDAPAEPIRKHDRKIAGLMILAALVPVYTASAAVMTAAALYLILTSEAGTSIRRAAIIFLAMTGSLIWGPLLISLLNGPVLGIDAFLVSRLAGAGQIGNQVAFTDGSGSFVIAPGCSSFHGMSLALVFWATVNQWFGVRFTWGSLLTVLAALAATIAVNAGRIVAIAHFPAHYDALHTGWGAQVATWTTLLLVVAICLIGARRHVLAPR